jgi:hypothetical protein
MSNDILAFKEPIRDGLIRILLRIGDIECEVENDAPDFVDPLEDHPVLTVTPEADLKDITNAFMDSYPLVLNKRKSREDKIVWSLPGGGIWFDMEMDNVKEVWLTEFSFFIESEKPRYLAYYIRDVEHNIEWLQPDAQSGEIRSLSTFKKKFTPPPVSERNVYSGGEILKCADMLGRAIKKIDMRTQEALVRFNTEKGNLEPLLIGMAEKLGYTVKSLDKEVIEREGERGRSVSHSISLQ